MQPAGASPSTPPQPGTPAYLQQAYDLSYLSQTAGGSDTVAVVDAYDDPNAESDLAAYRANYALPPCTTANGCFTKVNQHGQPSPLPGRNSVWEEEESLDLDAVSALCPNCHIVVVEAQDASFTNLYAAVQQAAAMGVKQISASWTFAITGGKLSDQYKFTFPGIATVAATGDTGYLGANTDNYPAARGDVTAAGGTTLTPTGGARGFSEGAWSLSGGQGASSGCALPLPKPSYQADTGCLGRAYADVSADADPATGLSFYDSGNGGWGVIGGTSLAAPLIAAYYAITGLDGTTPQWAYTNSALLNDPISGSNGSCASNIGYICSAGLGYDGPTGVGSISGAVVAGAPGIGGPSNASGNAYTYTQSIRSHGATLTGGIYPNGLDTTWSVQYGTSTAYGQQTTPSDSGAGTAPVAVTGYLLSLSPNTTYHYRLVAQNSSGTTYGYDYTFTTPAATATDPTASFIPPAATTPNSSAGFDAHSSTDAGASIIDYKWDFGDGTALVDAGPSATTSHIFGKRGPYRVTLTVKNSAGQTDVVQHTVTVDVAPTAAFSPSTAVTTPGSNLNFDANASTADPAGGSIAHYSWDFGDGTTDDTGATPMDNHAYANPGQYTVTLKVTDDLNVTSTTATHTVTVDAVPKASFTAAPDRGDLAVAFDAGGSSDSFGTITSYSWDFGDGATDTDPDPTHTYTSRGTHHVTLTVTNDAGQSDTSEQDVVADVAPTAAFSPSTAVTTPGSNLNFDANASTADPAGGSIAHYSWDFGDGTTDDTGATPMDNHAYANPGQYTVTLKVTDDLNVTSTTATHTVTVDAVPKASFTAAPDRGDLAVAFDAGGSSDSFGTITSYSWDFGDGATDTDPDPTHTYTSRGTHHVTLTVTNDAGQSDTSEQDVVADVAPTAAFSPSTAVTTPGSNLNFDANASTADPAGGSIAHYSWDFGDGTTDDTGATPMDNHAYANPGQYTVTLKVTDDLNVTSTTATHTVTVDAVPKASFTAAPDRGDLAVAFDAGGSSDSFGTITSYSWDFGDGATDTDPDPTHTYTSRGTHHVTLTVTNDAGQSDTSEQDVVADVAPTAAFTAPSGAQPSNVPLSFDATPSTAPGGSIAEYTWDFGDGSTAPGSNPHHSYSIPGHYTVTLKVTDDLNVTSTTATHTVTVDAAPSATFSTSPNPATLGPAVSFDASGSSDSFGTITSYSWDFGDGSTGSGATGSHAYQTPGHYTITLTVTNDAGQTTVVKHSITVDATPASSFSVSPSTTRTGAPVGFNAGSSSDTVGTIVAYAWNFGDGASASGLTATHAYASPGSYTVALTVTNDAGQTATATQTVTVYAPPSASFSVAPATTLPGGAVNFNAGASSNPGGAITDYNWSFGDGATANGPAASHAYLRPGTYTVTLTVTGSLGLATSASHTVTVHPPSLSARLSARGRQRLTAVLKSGVSVSVFTSTAAKASFVVTMPTPPAKQQRKHGKRVARARTSTILRTRALRYEPGIHSASLKLSAATAAKLRTTGKPVTLTVQMILTDIYGRTIGRSVKLTVTR